MWVLLTRVQVTTKVERGNEVEEEELIGVLEVEVEAEVVKDGGNQKDFVNLEQRKPTSTMIIMIMKKIMMGTRTIKWCQ
jgi:hypothetical protein